MDSDCIASFEKNRRISVTYFLGIFIHSVDKNSLKKLNFFSYLKIKFNILMEYICLCDALFF